MRRQSLYLFSYLGLRILFVVMVLTVLASIITWMEGIKSLYGGEQSKALYFVLLNCPSFLSVSLVPGALLGIALGLHQLGKRHELVAFYAQGLSPWQVVAAPTLFLGLLLSLIYAGLLHGAVPATKHDSDALASELGISDPVTQLFSVQRHWVKTETSFVYVDHVKGQKKVNGVVWIDKERNEAPTLIAMGDEAEFRYSAVNEERVILEMQNARIFSLSEKNNTPLVQTGCEDALERFRRGETIQIDSDLCPMVPSQTRSLKEVETVLFEREIPKSLGALLQLTGHPEGFFTDELKYLLGHASKYGYSLKAYSAALKARYLWPFLMLWLCLFAALWSARTTPLTGIYFPFMVMLCTYLFGSGLVHLMSRIL